MKASLRTTLALSTIALALALAPTQAAHADATPPLEPWTAVDDSADPYLDCSAGVWLQDVINYYAEQAEPGVYSEAVVTTETIVYGQATGGPGSDCPNWQLQEDGSWVAVDAHPSEPDHSDTPDVPAADHPEHPADADAGIVWKTGLAVLYKVL